MSQAKEEARVGEVGDASGDPDEEVGAEEYCMSTWYSDETAHWDVEAK